ncbi:MAG: hypothetical protein HDS01_06520, partial [Bacteroides sp.]|nr:hypothetical protein [Bacteroides sp.]
MKKFFTLLAGVAMAVSVQAATIYSWSSKGPDASNVTEFGGKIEEVNKPEADVSNLNYPNIVGEVTNYTVCLSGKKSGDKTYGSSSRYMLINLDAPISEGSSLELTGYRNKNTDAIGSCHIEFINDEGQIVYVINEGNNRVWNNVHTSPDAGKTGNEDPNTNVYELPEEAIGATKVLLVRDQASTNLFLLSIKLVDQAPDVDVDTKIAVVSALGDLDPLYFAVQSGFEYTIIDANAEDVTLADLQEYEAVLVTPSVNADSKIAPVLREAVAYQPIVNASADLIQAWGLATLTPSESGMINVSEANLSHSFFGELPFEDGALELLPEGVLSTVTPGEYLANDDVLATVGEAPFILVHNASRNPHILIPFAADVLGDEAPENVNGLIANALKVAGKGKKTVTQAAAPAITSALGKLKTTVSISGAGVIRYAVGTADVTVDENSPVYTEPFEITENGTYVKAYAVQDGYLKSDV